MSHLEPSSRPAAVGGSSGRSRRESRTRLEQKISGVVRKDGNLLLEYVASEGTSPLWLSPVIMDAIGGAGQVLIVTATATRRRELVDLELPGMLRCCPEAFTVVEWQPTYDYLCLERLAHLQEQSGQQQARVTSVENQVSDTSPGMNRRRGKRPNAAGSERGGGGLPTVPGLSSGERSQLEVLAKWAEETVTGLGREKPSQITSAVWDQCTVSHADCLGDLCPAATRCFMRRTRRLEDLGVSSVGNYTRSALAGARIDNGTASLNENNRHADSPAGSRTGSTDAGKATPGSEHRNYAQGNVAREVPQAVVIVCDYETLFEHLEMKNGRPWKWLLPPHLVVVLDEAHALADLVRRSFAFELSRDTVRRLLLPLVEIGAAEVANVLWEEATRFFTRLNGHRLSNRYRIRLEHANVTSCAELERSLEMAAEVFAREAAASPPHAARLRRLHTCCLELAGRLESTISLTDHRTLVWLDQDREGYAVLRGQPIQVAPIIGSLFGVARSVIVASEMLTVGGHFQPIRQELGVPETAQELIEPARGSRGPRLLLVVPERIPDPTERNWPTAVTCRYLDIQNATDGRACGHFTSSEVIEHVQNHIRYLGARIERDELSGPALVDLASSDASGGSSKLSAEHGQEVGPGTTYPYTCVIIDRLPLPPADDPLLDITKEREPAWFVRFSLPRAVSAFRRAVVPLLRSSQKRAVLVVLDRRILSRPYGRLFLSCLPELTFSNRIDDIPQFLKGKDIRK